MSHTTSLPVMAEVARLPTAPTPSAITIETAPMTSTLTSLAVITRLRLGTSVNVVSAVRWLHSLVTARTPMIGRMMDIGLPTAAANESNVSPSRSLSRTVSTVAMPEVMTMLAISQKPDRVSNILRSSTPRIRPNGIGSGTTRSRGRLVAAVPSTLEGVMVAVLMPRLLPA